jgi:hypothetical protein
MTSLIPIPLIPKERTHHNLEINTAAMSRKDGLNTFDKHKQRKMPV